jgi:hypothetical protein
MSFHLAILATLIGVGLPRPAPDAGVVVGYVVKGHAFAFSRTLSKEPGLTGKYHGATLHLSRRPLTGTVGNRKGRKKERSDELYYTVDPHLPPLIRVHGDGLYLGYELASREVSLRIMDTLYESGDEAFQKEGPKDESGLSVSLYEVELGVKSWDLGPVWKMLMNINFGEGEDEEMAAAKRRLGYDLLPTGPNRAKLFWLDKGRMHVAEGTNRAAADTSGNPMWETTWAKPASFKAPFSGHFHAFASGDDYYFVTRAGAVYHSPKPAKGAARTAKAVDLDSRLADVALHDGKSGKTFVFCLAKRVRGKTLEGLYLELAPGQRPRKLKAGDVEALDRRKPIGAVWSAARLLRADKRIN